MAADPAYLDYNATTPLRPGVAEAMAAALTATGNPSSVHGPGRAARAAIERVRREVLSFIGGADGDLVFTSGGTEANALALHVPERRSLLISAIEHDSVRVPWGAAGAETIGVTPAGVIDLDALADRLAVASGPALVSLMAANNETGAIQPLAEAAAIAHRHGALIHCDATQAVGRIALEIADLGVDLLTLSAHKLGGPQGVGALWLRNGITLTPILTGGGQERGRRAGTENVAGIVGLGAAIATADRMAEATRVAGLRDRLEGELVDLGGEIVAAGTERLPNTSCVRMAGVEASTQVMALDLAGVAVSAGAACSAGKVDRSQVLAAMGYDDAAAGEAIRISLGWATTASHIERAIEAWRDLRSRTAARAVSAA